MGKALSDLATDDDEAAPRKRNRGVGSTYTFPEEVRRPGVATSFTLYEISSKDEQLASARGMFNMVKATHEAAKAAVGKIDGKAVDNSEGVVDEWWEEIGPRARGLVVSAYEKAHGVTKKTEEDFFKTAEVTTD